MPPHVTNSSLKAERPTIWYWSLHRNGKFLKANEGFYISLCSLSIQSVSFLLYIVLNPKLAFLTTLANPTKKNNTDKKQKDNKKTEENGEIINKKEKMEKNEVKDIQNKNKAETKDNIANYGNVDEDIDEKFSNNDGINNTNFHCREANELKLDTIQIENRANFKLERNMSRKSVSEDGKSLDEKDELNKKDNKINLNTIINKINSNTNTNTNTLAYITTGEEENNNKQKDGTDNDNDVFSLHGSVNKKLYFKEKEEKDFEEKIKIK